MLILPWHREPFSVAATGALSRAGFVIPGAVYIADVALLTLAIVTVASLVWSWRSRTKERSLLFVSALSVVLAYGLSEMLKLAFQEERPCMLWATVGTCDVADFSFPSNHATLAFGAVAVIAFATRRVGVVSTALVLAVVVALARVLEGAHYAHDVAAGAILGTSVPVSITALVSKVFRNRGTSRSVSA